MSEPQELLKRAEELYRQNLPAAYVTLCSAEGSSFRQLGTVALFEPSGRVTGVLTGGCLEQDLFELSRRCLVANTPQLGVYDLRTPEDRLWGSGSGCPGKLTFLAEPLSSPGAQFALASLRSRLAEDREERYLLLFQTLRPNPSWPIGSRWSVTSDGRSVTSDGNRDIPEGLLPILAELVKLEPGFARTLQVGFDSGESWNLLACSRLPASRLVILGAGRELLPLIHMARILGWWIEVVDFRPSPARAERFAGLARYQTARPGEVQTVVPLHSRTAVVVATHHFLDDLACLPELLQANLGYLGVVSSRVRKQFLVAELRKQFKSTEFGNRVDQLASPAGFDLGGEGPEAMALAILAEAHARLQGATGRPKSLQDRTAVGPRDL